MTTITGGLRDRLIFDSMWRTVDNGLRAIGWYNAGRDHLPVTFVPEQLNWDEQIALNTIAVAPLDVKDRAWELGSDFRQNRWVFYFDVFGEDEAIGNHLSGDIRDILRGKIPSIGRNMPVVNIYDYTQATPPMIGYCEVSKVVKERSPSFSHRWERYLYVIRVELDDYYDTVTDDADPWWQWP
jgi:hypothetical protein